jgi:hypothetical protein
MKTIRLDEIRDTETLSHILHLALGALQRKLGLKAGWVAGMLGLHASDLTRMRLLHVRPPYMRIVSRLALARVVQQVFDSFPTMELGETRRGHLVVRLYKRRGNARLVVPFGLPPSAGRQPRQRYRPGTTRWFLKYEVHEAATKDQQARSPSG